MSPAAQPLLANWIGYTAGAVVFGIFLVLLAKDLASRGLRAGWRTLAAGSMAFLWNAGALANLFVDSFLLRLASTAALSLLPALLLDLLVEGGPRRLVLAGYAVSLASIALHALEPLAAGFPLHHRTLQLTAAGFAPLTLAALVHLRRRRTPTRRAAAAMALLLFALSFTHLHRQDAPHAWLVELLVHHAGVPLSLWVLMQDYRFLLLDAFVRFLVNILLAAAFAWAGAVLAARAGWFDYRTLAPAQVVMAGAGVTLALVAFSALRHGVQRLLTRLVFRRGDAEALLEHIRRMPVRGEQEFLASARAAVAAFFEAGPVDVHSGAPPLPFGLGRRAGGRPYLSEDLALLARAESLVNEKLEHWREQHLRELLSQAELRALQARIHPHFLFNALNALYGSIPRTAPAARRAVLHLAEIFRYLLKGGEGLIPLERELEIVRAYLEIEALRLGDRLSWRIDVPPEALHAMIPTLSLQPLVENAVRHGVAPSGQPGEVCVAARIEEDACRIEVSDTGAGLAAGGNPEGIGLENVRRRLTLHFGGAAHLELKREAGRTVARFAVPMARPASAAVTEDAAP
ncbi:MAG: histidine kinase [Bryobacteraceae bacterium]|nr:histidine kinase [Bryobacteraceae bacterium]